MLAAVGVVDRSVDWREQPAPQANAVITTTGNVDRRVFKKNSPRFGEWPVRDAAQRESRRVAAYWGRRWVLCRDQDALRRTVRPLPRPSLLEPAARPFRGCRRWPCQVLQVPGR